MRGGIARFAPVRSAYHVENRTADQNMGGDPGYDGGKNDCYQSDDQAPQRNRPQAFQGEIAIDPDRNDETVGGILDRNETDDFFVPGFVFDNKRTCPGNVPALASRACAKTSLSRMMPCC